MKAKEPNKANVKLQLPKSDANKILNTAFGRGMAEAIAEKQARIDRLEALIFYAYGKIALDKDTILPFDDDNESFFIGSICEKYQNLKQKSNE